MNTAVFQQALDHCVKSELGGDMKWCKTRLDIIKGEWLGDNTFLND